jgi:hypothetical protein
MWGVTRRAPMTRAVNIPEYDRPLVTALVMAKSPRLAFGRAAVHPHHGMGGVAKVIVGNSSDDLEWLEAATTALGAQVMYMPIRRSDNRTAERERQLAMADAMSDVAYADEQAKAADAIIAGVSQHATDRELRRIVGEGRDAPPPLSRPRPRAHRPVRHPRLGRPGHRHRTRGRPPAL